MIDFMTLFGFKKKEKDEIPSPEQSTGVEPVVQPTPVVDENLEVCCYCQQPFTNDNVPYSFIGKKWHKACRRKAKQEALRSI